MAYLNRWDPIHRDRSPPGRDELDSSCNPSGGSASVPPVDIREVKDAIYVKAELPGVKPEEVHLHVENNILTLTGAAGKFDETDENREGFHRIERILRAPSPDPVRAAEQLSRPTRFRPR